MTGVRVGPTTVVKFRDVREQPGYWETHPQDAHNAWARDLGLAEKLAGQPVRILLPPVAAQEHWQCAPERVWEIAPGETERLTGRSATPGCGVFVCEHQVEID